MAIEVPGVSAVPAGAERRYAGKWIAVRDGDVVAVGDDYDDLVASDRVRPEDEVYCLGPRL